MTCNVRRMLCAASPLTRKPLIAVPRHSPQKSTLSRSLSDSRYKCANTEHSANSTISLSTALSNRCNAFSPRIPLSPTATTPLASLGLGLSTVSWPACSKHDGHFKHKIWDRRKPSVSRLRRCRNFSSSVRNLVQPQEQRSGTLDKPKDSPKAPDDALDPKRSEEHGRSQASHASKTVACDGSHKHLMDRLPNMPQIHRPSKEELLAAATGFWSRLKVRFKWFSIRSARPFNADEIGAFFSWVLVGHVLWIVLGTTTFFSLAILAVNTVFAQGKSLDVLVQPRRRSDFA